MRPLLPQPPPAEPRAEDCALLFDCAPETAMGMLDSLTIASLRDTFRRRVFPLHPDRARAAGERVDERTREFRRVTGAYERLCHAVRAREPAPPAAPSLPAEPLLLGQFLHYSGRISRDAVAHAVSWQSGLRAPFGILAQEWRFLSEAQVAVIRRARRPGERFGDAGRRLGYLRAEQCETVLWAQRQAHRRIGQYFVEEGLVTAAELCVLVEALRQHNRAVRQPRRVA